MRECERNKTFFYGQMWKLDRVGGLSSTGCITKEQRGQFQAGVDGWTLRRGRDSKEREERNEGGWGNEDGGCDQQAFCIFCFFSWVLQLCKYRDG